MQENNNHQNKNEEIDLGDLFKLFKKGLNKIGHFILAVIIFLKKNAIILLALIITGIVIGYFIQNSSESSVTLQSFYGSQDYLYKSVNELNWEIKNKTDLLAEEFNINPDTLKLIKLEIKPLERVTDLSKEKKEYITLLKEEGSYTQEDLMAIVLRSSGLHKLIITHPENFNVSGFFDKFEEKLLKNKSFTEIHQTEIKNLKESVETYRESIRQIDTILSSYNAKLNEKSEGNATFYSSENNLNVGEIISEKRDLRFSINKLEETIAKQKNFISPLDEPKTAELKEPIASKEILSIPSLLILLFLGIKFLIYLNKKANQYEREK